MGEILLPRRGIRSLEDRKKRGIVYSRSFVSWFSANRYFDTKEEINGSLLTVVFGRSPDTYKLNGREGQYLIDSKGEYIDIGYNSKVYTKDYSVSDSKYFSNDGVCLESGKYEIRFSFNIYPFGGLASTAQYNTYFSDVKNLQGYVKYWKLNIYETSGTGDIISLGSMDLLGRSSLLSAAYLTMPVESREILSGTKLNGTDVYIPFYKFASSNSLYFYTQGVTGHIVVYRIDDL